MEEVPNALLCQDDLPSTKISELGGHAHTHTTLQTHCIHAKLQHV